MKCQNLNCRRVVGGDQKSVDEMSVDGLSPHQIDRERESERDKERERESTKIQYFCFSTKNYYSFFPYLI